MFSLLISGTFQRKVGVTCFPYWPAVVISQRSIGETCNSGPREVPNCVCFPYWPAVVISQRRGWPVPALALMIPYNLLRNVGSWFRPTPLYSCPRGEDGGVGCGVVVQADPV